MRERERERERDRERQRETETETETERQRERVVTGVPFLSHWYDSTRKNPHCASRNPLLRWTP